jgi:hypothetical protein
MGKGATIKFTTFWDHQKRGVVDLEETASAPHAVWWLEWATDIAHPERTVWGILAANLRAVYATN